MLSNGVADRTADASTSVLIVGDGVIGLSTAFALSRARVHCRVIGARRDGMASGAAAGLLAPSIGHLPDAVRPFFEASLREYPEFIERLSRFDADLTLLTGLIEVVSADRASERRSGARYLTSSEVARLEPAIVAPDGALLHEHDGAVDNGRLMQALRAAARQSGALGDGNDPVATLHTTSRLSVSTTAGERIAADWIVLAAGAWTPAIDGLPCALPVEPLKGQMLAVGADPARLRLKHAVMGNDVYLVPRGDDIVIGATAERVGFDLSVQPSVIESLQRSASAVCPPIADAPVRRSWAGIRPATPDMLPIIGPDPDVPHLVYACGHSKNGILLAPATARAITELITGVPATLGTSEFSIGRFASRSASG